MKIITDLLNVSRATVMGILNVTPDSFSDGGQFNQPQQALSRVQSMLAEGVDIIDIGGESTRPGAKAVTLEQELERTIPVIQLIRQHSDIAISIDTSQPQVMLEAASAGANLINDVRALQKEGAIAAAKKTALPVCLMHMQGQPKDMQQAPCYDDVVAQIETFFSQRIVACQQAGIDLSQICLDPGFGFGKTLEHNYQLLNHLPELEVQGLPLLVGMSRKRMIAQVLDDCAADQRLFGSVAAAVIAAQKNAKILRVHDVKATVDAMKIVAALQQNN